MRPENADTCPLCWWEGGGGRWTASVAVNLLTPGQVIPFYVYTPEKVLAINTGTLVQKHRSVCD